MNTCQTAILITAGLCIHSAAAQPAASQMRDATTHEQLVQALRKTAQRDPITQMEPAKGSEDPSKTNRPKDILSESDIISFGGYTTLVPKRAILNMPENLLQRLKYQPGTQIIGWAEFYAKNRGWISIVEVSRVQAEGNQPLDEDVVKRYKDSTNLTVATFQGGPISVLPLKEPSPQTADVTSTAP